jgi:hypothetical protein
VIVIVIMIVIWLQSRRCSNAELSNSLSPGILIRHPSYTTLSVHVPIVADDADKAILAALCETRLPPSLNSHGSPTFHQWQSIVDSQQSPIDNR